MDNKIINLKKKIRGLCIKVAPKLMSKRLYKQRLNKKLNLKNPQTFNEKIQWLKLYYCPNNPLVIQCADKYLAREYIKERGYGQYLNKLIGVWDSVDEIDWDRLPEKFAIKCNHGCGYNIICDDKSKLDISEAEHKLRNWMASDYNLVNVEPHYRKIPRKIICEEYIENESGNSTLPADYKIHCFHGEPKVIGYYIERDIKMKRFFYDTNWNVMEIGKEKHENIIEKPVCLGEMLEISRALSRDFPYVRMDYYVSNNRPIFGEFTFTPAGGRAGFFTEEGDMLLGKMLNLELVK